MRQRTSRHAWQRAGLIAALVTGVLLVISQSWVQADPIRELTPPEQTTEAHYRSGRQTSMAGIAPPKYTEIVPTSSPQPPIDFITTCGGHFPSAAMTTIENCWLGGLDGQAIIVYALWKATNPNQSIVRVFPVRPDGTVRGGSYYTPQAIGPMRITAVTNGVLTLVATGNSTQQYRFDVGLRQYYDANGNPLAAGVSPDDDPIDPGVSLQRAYPAPSYAQPSAAYPPPQ